VKPGHGLPPGEQAKLRFYFTSGSVVGVLGVIALAAGEFRTGLTSLVIGVAALVLGVKRGQGLVAGAGRSDTGARTEAQAMEKTTAKAKAKTGARAKTTSATAKARARATTEAAAFTAWYTVGLGLVLMGAGAATTVLARDSETTTAEILLFLAAGVLLWMGVTCLIAARVKVRGRGGPAPERRPPKRRPPKPRPGRQRAG